MQDSTPYNHEGNDNAKISNLSFSESQPDSYQAQYAALATWVDGSLEDLRPELTQVRKLVQIGKNTCCSSCMLIQLFLPQQLFSRQHIVVAVAISTLRLLLP